MLEYRIPAARFLSAAIMGVCFLIALIVINMQAASRSRTFGLLGVTMVLASTGLQALHGSLAGAYGRNTVVHGVGSIIVAALAAAGLVLLALAVTRARKARRTRGGH
jgi:hypothetical protein